MLNRHYHNLVHDQKRTCACQKVSIRRKSYSWTSFLVSLHHKEVAIQHYLTCVLQLIIWLKIITLARCHLRKSHEIRRKWENTKTTAVLSQRLRRFIQLAIVIVFSFSTLAVRMKLLTGAYCVGLLFFGVCNTITSKTQYMLTAPGADGKERTFDKPYFQSIVMFVAMMVVLIPHYMNEVSYTRMADFTTHDVTCLIGCEYAAYNVFNQFIFRQ